MATMKVVVMGGIGVGKSALTIRFTENLFVDEYDPTIEDSYRKQISIGKQFYVLEILDTAGQEEFNSIRSRYIREGEGFLLVYSVTEEDSLAIVDHICADILRVKDLETVPMIIVGNKKDLINERLLTTDQGNAFADQLNCTLIETSAKTGSNIEQAFLSLAKAILATLGGTNSK